MHHLTIAELIKGLESKQFSSEEITKTYLTRIEKFDPQLNSFITC